MEGHLIGILVLRFLEGEQGAKPGVWIDVLTVLRGRKDWIKGTGVPMTKQEYVKWYTEDCPPYIRLDEDTALKRWVRDFADASIHRDQVPSNDKQGNYQGLVTSMQLEDGFNVKCQF